MKTSTLPLELAAALCDRLGIAGYVAVSAEELPEPEAQAVAQGFAPMGQTADLHALVFQPGFFPRPIGLPDLSRAGWRLSRALDSPSVVVLSHIDNGTVRCVTDKSDAIFACDRSTWAVDVARIPGGVVFTVEPADPDRPPQPMVAVWQPPDAPITAVVLVQRLTANVLDAQLLPQDLVPAEQLDPWLHGFLRAQLSLTDPLEVWMAAARCWRWTDPPGDPRPYIEWARTLGSGYAQRIQSLAAARSRQAEEGLDCLLEYAEPEVSEWCAAVDSIALDRDGLQGVRTLLLKILNPIDLLELQEAVEDLDAVGASLPAVFAAWPAADPEAARRAWLAEPEAWWTAHEHERANEGWEDD
jgi:hypothetical protein